MNRDIKEMIRNFGRTKEIAEETGLKESMVGNYFRGYYVADKNISIIHKCIKDRANSIIKKIDGYNS